MGGWGVPKPHPLRMAKGDDMDDEGQGNGFTDLFYIMLAIGIIGLVGFLAVGAGAMGGI
jgi:hypothetical protein